MIIQCENCGTQHELDPPSWVVSSGRAFRFRCSACGHSQSVQPDQGGRELGAVVAPTEVPATRSVAPSGPPAEASRPPTSWSEPRPKNPTLAPASELRPALLEPTVAPPALLDSMPPAAERTRAPEHVTHATHGLLDAAPAPLPPPVADNRDNALFLKQNGQIYRVQDWETLRRWIDEGRVDLSDLMSEGGVRWEPIGSRPELAGREKRSPLSAPPPVSAPFPFGGDSPFATPAGVDRAWADDDTEGVPTGLPPLPTEESMALDQPGPSEARAVASPEQANLRYEPTGEVVSPLDPTEIDTMPGEAVTPAPAAPSTPPVFPGAFDQGPSAGSEWEDLLHTGEAPLPTPSLPPVAAPVPTLPPRAPRAVAPSVPASVPPSVPPSDPGSIPPGEFDAEWEEGQGTSSRWLPLAAAATLFAVVLVGAALWFWAGSRTPDVQPAVPVPVAAPPPPPVAPAVAPVEPAAVEPAVVEPALVEPAAVEPAVVAPAVVAPVPAAPAPAPVPAPVRPSNSAQALVQKGWNVTEANPSQAQSLFRQALDLDPGSDEAAYGLGYSLLLQDRVSEATPWLCKVRNSRIAEVRQDANGMIKNRQLQCQ